MNDLHPDYNDHLDAISEQHFSKETGCVKHLLKATALYGEFEDAIEEKSHALVQAMREAPVPIGVEQFIQQFGLSEPEAIALLCLAESLLRIPDTSTADALIHDTLSGADWQKFLIQKDDLGTRTQLRALMLSTDVTELRDSDHVMDQIMYNMSEPVLRNALKAAMHLLGNAFVSGKTIEDAWKRSENSRNKGYLFSFDMLGEAARTEAQAAQYQQSYLHAIDVLGKVKNGDKQSISVKLSALYPKYDYLHRDAVHEVLYPRLLELCNHAAAKQVAISLDAEEADRLDLQCELFTRLLHDDALADSASIGFVLQAYGRSALAVIAMLRTLAQRTGRNIPVRLVKGAYWDSEITHAQMEGYVDYPVFTQKCYTDVSYLACANALLDAAQDNLLFPQFATHNVRSVISIQELARQHYNQADYEFQRLFGMGERLYESIVKHTPCRVYAPVGAFNVLLPYLIRRLMENGANSNFVNQLMDKSVPISALTVNPCEEAKQLLERQTPSIPLPSEIFTDRQNSSGVGLGNRVQLAALLEGIKAHDDTHYTACPVINGTTHDALPERAVASPANTHDTVGVVRDASDTLLTEAIVTAQQGFADWNHVPISKRADILDEIAEQLADHRDVCISLLMREAGKTLHDTIAEWREAIDFCRYYAAQARILESGVNCDSYTGESNHLSYTGKGVIACISPWNFPLAIYVGQIVAALVAGNSVIAKPAETTSLTAAFVTKLMYQADIPAHALQFVPCAGSVFSRHVLTSHAISGVMFTGSTTTAQHINRTLAARDTAIATLVAETGGQNCMIVDSSALLEQAVDHIIISAFGSAGQRCSALRVLYVHDSIYDTLKEMVTGAMALLNVGHGNVPSTDIGAVISQQAHDALLAHVDNVNANNYTTLQPPENGHYITPHLCEIPHISALDKEHFGPVLHMIRYKDQTLDPIIDEINSSGYGLTFGLNSRINQRIRQVSASVRAGNIYVNRSMTGAVVGVQPFGGMGLSGTGPKAGGPDYIKALMNERHVSNNMTAIGGNMQLLHQTG